MGGALRETHHLRQLQLVGVTEFIIGRAFARPAAQSERAELPLGEPADRSRDCDIVGRCRRYRSTRILQSPDEPTMFATSGKARMRQQHD
jgi:hypothetical protein